MIAIGSRASRMQNIAIGRAKSEALRERDSHAHVGREAEIPASHAITVPLTPTIRRVPSPCIGVLPNMLESGSRATLRADAPTFDRAVARASSGAQRGEAGRNA